ncbi:MAG: hypothetical protein JSW25_06250, partial [Thermoplasmata archaeon]
IEEYNEYWDDHNMLVLNLWVVREVCILIMIWTLAIVFIEIHKGVPARIDPETLRWFEMVEEMAEREADDLGIKVDMPMLIAICHQEGFNKFQIAEYYGISLADVNAGITIHLERMEELAGKRDLQDL